MSESNMAQGSNVSGQEPSQETIEQRAYEIYMRRGGEGAEAGDQADDWRQAEEELRNEMSQQANRQPQQM